MKTKFDIERNVPSKKIKIVCFVHEFINMDSIVCIL